MIVNKYQLSNYQCSINGRNDMYKKRNNFLGSSPSMAIEMVVLFFIMSFLADFRETFEKWSLYYYSSSRHDA